MIPYNVTGAANEAVKIEANDKTYAPPEIGAMVLQNLKKPPKTTLAKRSPKQ